MKIKYKIKEVKPGIFAVVIKDNYDRAMTFCRAQEHYESPNSKFRGKDFSIWDFMKWYSNEYGSFSYAHDWGGFNIPLSTAVKCYSDIKHETPYDDVMNCIIGEIETIMFNKKNMDNYNAYIIGAESLSGETFRHEMCHALYTTNKDYKKQVDEITSSLGMEHSNAFAYNLLNMGYTAEVIPDEIQAYLSTSYESSRFSKGVEKDALVAYHEKYKKVLEKF